MNYTTPEKDGRFGYAKMSDQDIKEDPFFEACHGLAERVRKEICSDEIYIITEIDENDEIWNFPADIAKDLSLIGEIGRSFDRKDFVAGAIDILYVKDAGMVVTTQDASPIGVYLSEQTLKRMIKNYPPK
jgi:hypothetical protein